MIIAHIKTISEYKFLSLFSFFTESGKVFLLGFPPAQNNVSFAFLPRQRKEFLSSMSISPKEQQIEEAKKEKRFMIRSGAPRRWDDAEAF